MYARAGRSEGPAVDERFQLSAQEPEARQRLGAGVILIGCVQTRNAVASAASELFAGPLFEERRRYAAASGLPWYILSAKFGLLVPDDVIGPYDMDLATQSPGYRKAWGQFVAAQLDAREHALRRRRIEVHASAAYVDSLRAPLAGRGAGLALPVAHLRLGEQLAWYHTCGVAGASSASAPLAATPQASASDMARLLSDPSRALSAQELFGRGHQGVLVPGMYSWLVDDQGAADLSRGLGQTVPGGLIYAVQAGATRRPIGKSSQNTTQEPITGRHLGAIAEFSMFRRTLAAILRPALHLDTENDPQLSAWINTHLGVDLVPAPDPVRLAEIEAAVLDVLDPPLNLHGRPPSAIRARLAELLRDSGADPLPERH
jgi:hypothetical protein